MSSGTKSTANTLILRIERTLSNLSLYVECNGSKYLLLKALLPPYPIEVPKKPGYKQVLNRLLQDFGIVDIKDESYKITLSVLTLSYKACNSSLCECIKKLCKLAKLGEVKVLLNDDYLVDLPEAVCNDNLNFLKFWLSLVQK